MGRMKEVFMAMREDEWNGCEQEYLEHYVRSNGLYCEKEKLKEDTDISESDKEENNFVNNLNEES